MNKELRKVLVKENEFKDGVLQPVEVEFQFVNEYFSTSRSWGHISTLYKNGVEVATNKVRYYNRTWEAYQYQSVMAGLVYQLKEDYINDYIRDYKEKNNISKFKKGQKQLVIDEAKTMQAYKEYNLILDAIHSNKFDN